MEHPINFSLSEVQCSHKWIHITAPPPPPPGVSIFIYAGVGVRTLAWSQNRNCALSVWSCNMHMTPAPTLVVKKELTPIPTPTPMWPKMESAPGLTPTPESESPIFVFNPGSTVVTSPSLTIPGWGNCIWQKVMTLYLVYFVLCVSQREKYIRFWLWQTKWNWNPTLLIDISPGLLPPFSALEVIEMVLSVGLCVCLCGFVEPTLCNTSTVHQFDPVHVLSLEISGAKSQREVGGSSMLQGFNWKLGMVSRSAIKISIELYRWMCFLVDQSKLNWLTVSSTGHL